MVSVKETHIYDELIKEFNYSFGDVFLFEGFLISEYNEGISFNWDDHASIIAEDIADFLGGGNGSDLIYISNRINSYSVVPGDWLKFYKRSYNLKSYCIVSESKGTIIGSMIENLFFKDKIKRFNSVYIAVNWVKNDMNKVA